MKQFVSDEKPALELLQEAFHLLRSASAWSWAAYLAGTLPFVLGLLYFWSDMARSALAAERLGAGSWLLAAGFFWMKTWQAVFTRRLLAQLCGQPEPWPSWIQWLRIAAIQGVLQPVGLFLFPVAFLIMLPFGWVQAFFNNATLYSAEPEATLRTAFARSWRQCLLWPAQNHSLLLVHGLFCFVVFLNLFTAVMAVPQLLHTLFGLETAIVQNPWVLLNSTLVAGLVALTYLCGDPLLKAAYVLRCFYGESLRTGQDLQAQFNLLSSRLGLVWLIGLLFMAPLPATRGATLNDSTPNPGQPAPQLEREAGESARIEGMALNRSVADVLQRREYAWRFPRESKAAPSPAQGGHGWSARLRQMVDAMSNWAEEFWRWMQQLISGSGLAPSPSSFPVGQSLFLLLAILVVLGALGWVAYYFWRTRRDFVAEEMVATVPVPDLADEAVGAEQLPEEGWQRLARELLDRGELRLGLRALYLATLSHLATRQYLTLARFKANRVYEGELRRRGHSLGELPDLFAANLSLFERVWYGRHEITPRLVHEFSTNLDKIKCL